MNELPSGVLAAPAGGSLPLSPAAANPDTLAVYLIVMPTETTNMKEKLTILILGALLGAGPIIVNSWLQAKWVADERAVERKLDAIRAFSKACYRGLAVSQRSLMLADLALDLSDSRRGGGDPRARAEKNLAEHVELELGAIQRDLDEAFVDYRAEMALANVLFGTQIEPGMRPQLRVPALIGPLNPKESEDLRRQVSDFRDSVQSLQRKCEGSATLLITELRKGG